MKSKNVFGALVVILLGLVSCVDINKTNIPPGIDYRTMARFAHFAVGVGAANITLDETAVGSVNFGAETAYGDYPAGTRVMKVTYSAARDTVKKAFETDRKVTVFIVGDATARDYIVANERYIFAAKGVKDSALVRVFNASPDAGNVNLTAVAGTTTASLASNLAFKKASAYAKVVAGTYQLTAVAGSDTLFKNVSQAFAALQRYTIAVYDQKASIKQKVLVDD